MIENVLQNRLRRKTNKLYLDLQKASNKWSDDNGERCVPFKAIVGEKFPIEENSGIVFYGRCNNGWEAYNRDCSYKEQKLSDFFTARSPFLNLMYWEYWYFYKEDWMDYAVYNNTAKLVPETAKNCSDVLWDKQYDIMKKIIRIENEVLSPKFTVLVLGNSDGSNGWEWPFKELGFLDNKIDDMPWDGGSSSIFKNREQYFILTDRPEFRKIEPHAEAIWELMNKANNGEYNNKPR